MKNPVLSAVAGLPWRWEADESLAASRGGAPPAVGAAQEAASAANTSRIWPVSAWKSRNRRFKLTPAPIQ